MSCMSHIIVRAMYVLKRLFRTEQADTKAELDQSKLVRKVGRKGKGKGNFNMPCGVAVTKAGKSCVSLWGSMSVCGRDKPTGYGKGGMHMIETGFVDSDAFTFLWARGDFGLEVVPPSNEMVDCVSLSLVGVGRCS